MEEFYGRVLSVSKELETKPNPGADAVFEKYKVFENWDDWREAESNAFMIYYVNENIGFAQAIEAWFRRVPASPAEWKFRSAAADTGAHVIATLPNGQELELAVTRGEGGWAIDRFDPIYSEPIQRGGSLEDFATSFVHSLLELESALPAVFFSDDPESFPFLYYSSRQQTRLVDSTRDQPIEDHHEGWNPYWSDSYTWSSAQHRAWRNGWNTELSIYDVIRTEDLSQVFFVSRFSDEQGNVVAQPEILQVMIDKEESGWYVDIYADWVPHSYFEFHNDGKGNWNYQPPARD